MHKIKHMNTKKNIALAGFGALAIVSASAADSVATFVSEGLKDSKDIRVSESTICSPSQAGADANFVGCNSIL